MMTLAASETALAAFPKWSDAALGGTEARALTSVEQRRDHRLLDTTPRPSWMPPPPLETLLPLRPTNDSMAEAASIRRQPRHRREVSCTLVSVGIRQPYEGSLHTMGQFASRAGFNRTQLWRLPDFLADPLTRLHREKLNQMDHRDGAASKHPYRPFCAAFKPIALWRAMMQSREGDYVMWADSSKYHINQSIRGNVHDAMARLRERGLARMSALSWPPTSSKTYRINWKACRERECLHSAGRWNQTPWFQRRFPDGWAERAIGSAYGQLTCSAMNCEPDLYHWNRRKRAVNAVTAQAYHDLIPNITSFWYRPHLLNSNILLENTPQNRLLIWDWLSMAIVKPTGFCNSQVQDQAAFTILVLNRSLPIINPCLYLHSVGYEKCVGTQKGLNYFLNVLLADGAYEVVPASEFGELNEGYLDRFTAVDESSQ